LFKITPDYDLNLMKPDQSLAQITAAIISGLDPVMQSVKPDWILVQGDTTTVMGAALVGFYHRVKIGHVEAGLRTGDKYQPFPEEANRRLTDVLSDLYFAPTEPSRQNLLREGVPDALIRVTGNTSIDALKQVAALPYDWAAGPLAAIDPDRRLILVTAHRRENFGEPFLNLCQAIRELALQHPDINFVYPVHLNPHVQQPVHAILEGINNIHLIAPLDYLPMVHLMAKSSLVLTDSGGIQEEAPSLGKPVLVMRETTERPEAVAAGVARLVGTNRDFIIQNVNRLLNDAEAYRRMAQAANPFGDGTAAQKIVDSLLS
ncbi:MAG: UDP-N-acetylglucosamine 2-epimerase (non-hydrolyzing), partial [Anaerolineae bacterium]|nr:UDP-N-acetylglucosamine 2-epimerase (non-hydrolyzing) [Anaerolineae bacterium]